MINFLTSNTFPLFFTAIVSILSIFMANYLGRKSSFADYKQTNKEKRYLNFYVPIIKKLYSITKGHYSLNTFSIINGNFYYLTHFIVENFELASTEIAEMYQVFYPILSEGSRFYTAPEEYKSTFENDAIEAEKLFTELIEQILKEAIVLSKELGLPNIAQPLLETFSEDNYYKNNLSS